MPLPDPAPRTALHNRDITLRGYQRNDGMVDVEAHMVDTKTIDIPMADGHIRPAGAALHDMWLRMTVTAGREIVGCEVAMDSTPYEICPQAAPNFSRLVGLSLEGGFVREALTRVGGVEGCTHLRELLQQVATVAIQTLYSMRSMSKRAGDGKSAPRLPPLLNTCAAYDETGPVIRKMFPAFYTGDAAD